MNKLKKNIFAKIGALILSVISVFVIYISAMCLVYSHQVNYRTHCTLKENAALAFSDLAISSGRYIVDDYFSQTLKYGHIFNDFNNYIYYMYSNDRNATFKIYDEDGNCVFDNVPANLSYNSVIKYLNGAQEDLPITDTDTILDTLYIYEMNPFKTVIAFYDENGIRQERDINLSYEVYINPKLPYSDTYRDIYHMLSIIDFAGGVTGLVIFLILSTLILITMIVFLFSSAGHSSKHEGIRLTFFDKIPYDIFLAVYIIVVGVSLSYFIDAMYFYSAFSEFVFELTGAAVSLSALVLSGFIASTAVRIKAHCLFRNTLIYIILRQIKRIYMYFSKNIKILWKSIIIIIFIFVLDILAFCFSIAASEAAPFIVFTLLLTALIFYMAAVLCKLKKAITTIANGDVNYKVDYKMMCLEARKCAIDINHIGDGISVAVDEAVKSERLKAELITNVSHDIKTPLTSIINYSDLLEKEKLDNEKAAEYVHIVNKHSNKLKRLIDDLVEASKASSGNVEMQMERCDATIMLSQVIGEFEDKATANNISLILDIPENPIYIMADGRHLFRIFDNLLNNICKYSMPGTRAYLSLKETKENISYAVIEFKNISEYPLNISPDELTERFVRGDSSRHSEGNGLGLSIVRSFTELQNGRLEINIDGDLFKVILKFPTVK